jgi:hypothetical protein
MSLESKVIQIAVGPENEDNYEALYVLTEDGAVLVSSNPGDIGPLYWTTLVEPCKKGRR